MSKIRLVAYRKATSSSTSDSTYELDLQEHPNVSLNFQFSDIKEPETRKGSYSQTFKLPFTNNNNEFFQNWFNVNLETLVFSARQKFDAVLYVGTVPQFEGFIQLKSVYQKAQVYEIVLMSNTSSLFSTIGEQKLKDVFRNDDGSYSDELNHTFNETQMVNSWNGSSSAFVNSQDPAVSLRDSDAGVQKVMYPFSATQPSFYYNPDDTTDDGGYNKYLAMDSGDVTGLGVEDANEYVVPITQFRPSVQIKTLLKLIIAKAGFSYSSDFIDSAYFGKLFMTTCGHLAEAGTPITSETSQPSGLMVAGNNGTWGGFFQSSPPSGEQSVDYIVFPANTDCVDGYSLWNTTSNYFTKSYSAMTTLTLKHKIAMSNIEAVSGNFVNVDIIVQKFNVSTGVSEEEIYDTYTLDCPNNSIFEPNYAMDLSSMPVGASARILMRRYNFQRSSASSLTFNLGNSANYTTCDLDSKIKIEWDAYNPSVYGNVVNIPSCIGDNITQKAFLKDILQRFNLLVITDPNDAANLIIEPYNDYLSDGEIKYWTDKLDTSKEIIVKDTTQLQKKTVHLSDQEDVDLVNKEFKERYPEINVYGHFKQEAFNNDFATGELKNEAIFSPYINSKVFKGSNSQAGTHLTNVAVQYEFSYEYVEGGVENKLAATKPKLFYYNGAATTVLDSAGSTVTYYLHNQPPLVYEINTYSFTTYPVCTPFDITPSSNVYTLSESNKSLYWNATPPIAGELQVFNYNGEVGTWFNNTLYGFYWKNYLDTLYSTEARIMECNLNLNEVDIFNFKFNDEIFIKDAYWRILNIHNYQVGGKVSTKVTLIKVVDSLIQTEGCDYVLGEIDNNNTFAGFFYIWCPEGTPGCTPDITAPDFAGLFTTPDCCNAYGGLPFYWVDNEAANGLYPCLANSGSLPIRLKSLFNVRSILDEGQVKSIINDKLGGLSRPLIRGSANTKYNTPLLPYFGDDIIIKYNTARKGTPQINGESHRIIASGYTEGNTRSYAYPQGNKNGVKIFLPADSNTIIRINGIATVIGGTSSTYTLGTTEAFSYYTAFKNVNGTVTQLSTVGGQQEFSIREGANPTTCTLYITTSSGQLQFGLDDSQTDTKRVWQLSVDLSVQKIHNLGLPYAENWALYQNGDNIQFMNYDLMIWN